MEKQVKENKRRIIDVKPAEWRPYDKDKVIFLFNI
jgi:hypothetical protein